MIKRYYSSYTGKQIDEAVKTIVENQIGLEDLSPELVAEIKSWVATGEGGEGIRELEFKSHTEFPLIGNPLMLYIATDEDCIYYWSVVGKGYKPITSPTPEALISQLTKHEQDIQRLETKLNSDVSTLQSQINGVNLLISNNAAKIASHDSKLLLLENSLKDKADLAALNDVKTSVENLSGLIGLRKEGEKRSVFEILESQEKDILSLEEKINLTTSSVEVLEQEIPLIGQYLKQLTAKDVELEEGLSTLAGAINTIVPVLDSEIKALTSRINKYEVVSVEGLIVDYRDKEIRLNTQRVVPTHQSVGENGNPNMYYVTFKAYAPEGAVSVIEGNNGQMDAEASELSTDASGRKYTTIWAAIANYSNGTWTKWGDNSTLDKYFGFLYAFKWLDASGNTIDMDQVRVILTNDACHMDLVPDAIARRIDEKVKEISHIDLNDYYTKNEIDALLKDEVEEAMTNAGYVNEVDDLILQGGNA